MGNSITKITAIIELNFSFNDGLFLSARLMFITILSLRFVTNFFFFSSVNVDNEGNSVYAWCGINNDTILIQ